MEPVGLQTRVAALLADRLDAVLARGIFETDDPARIAALVEGWCGKHLGAPVAACEQFTLSVGAVFVVRLAGGERVALKVHGPSESRWGASATLPALRAAYAVQDSLARAGLPFAKVLVPPAKDEGRVVVAMSVLDHGPTDDPHGRRTTVAMTELLAEIARRVAGPVEGLPRWGLPDDALWPRPHNALFDLALPGGEWVDELASGARAQLAALPAAERVLYTDASAENVRVCGGKVAAVFDGDSFAVVDEMQCLAVASTHFTYAPHRGWWRWPDPTEVEAFVDAYAVARGRPLDDVERRRLRAAQEYAMAYTARCELAIGRHLEAKSMWSLLRGRVLL